MRFPMTLKLTPSHNVVVENMKNGRNMKENAEELDFPLSNDKTL